MISVNIAFDEQDSGLGDFFNQCKQDLIDFLEHMSATHGNGYTIDEINTGNCNEVYIEQRIAGLNTNNYLFIAYSHGDADCLTAAGAAYIHSDSNTHLFSNAFFYAVACSVGSRLGQALIDRGCHVFIGYKDTFYILHKRLQLAINCANIGIKMFLSGNTVEEAFRLIEKFYNQEIDKLMNFNDVIAASLLVKNKNALVVLGNNNLTINDFNV